MGKKTFTGLNNPALQFISIPTEADSHTPVVTTATIIKQKSESTETKSRRLQLLMRPSLHIKLKNIAVSNGLSLNDLINATLEASTNGEG